MEENKKISVLIVEDDENIREFLREVLDDYLISMASDGDEAIGKIRDNKFDLVITDLRMPNIPGEEVVKYVHDHKPDTKVIVISGYSSRFAVNRSVSNGADAFLSKPFSIKELIQTVSKVLGS
jgi:YesN/AraC family two-component response regulator